MDTLIALQQSIQAAVSDHIGRFGEDGGIFVLLSILPIGAVFGAIHALTPGHGKSILASYLIGAPTTVVRAIAVAGALSVTHVASAVLLALVGAPLLARTLAGAGRSDLVEDISRGAVAAIGVWLIWRALRNRAHVHGEGLAVGVAAGLVPCPLTLFAMVFALSRGIPEAGLAFAVAMLIGIFFTLGLVAVAVTVLRGRFLTILDRHGAAMERLARALDLLAGGGLVALGLWGLAR